MVLNWFGGGVAAKPVSIADLIARKKYDKALELLREQFKQGSRDPRLRLQMADVLTLAGKGKEAVPILVGLADEYAHDGFAAKAIALFKKIDKIDPGRKDVEAKLATLIQEPTHVPLRARAPHPPSDEIDITMSGVSAASIQTQIDAIRAERAASAPPAAQPASPPEMPAPPMGTATPAVEPPMDAVQESVEAQPPAEEEELILSEDVFRDQLLDVIQEVLVHPGETAPPGELELDEPAVGARSPLFSDFSQEELIAVMQGLRLISYEAGDIIITEGEPGDSLFVLTTGIVKAWIRNPTGHHVQVREMEEGSFFGEISILTGKPRTATVTAGARCELLELDRSTLDEITTSHPRVRQVLEDFYKQRHGSASEAMIRSGVTKRPGE